MVFAELMLQAAIVAPSLSVYVDSWALFRYPYFHEYT